jgi:serine/threonine-protein kinase
MNSLSKPTRIGAYDIVAVIGRGGMGTVFKATDPRIGRAVAIKVLTAAADDPDLLARFYREAKYTGSLQHQNIVTVYELGHQDGIPYLVMEYLEGVSLDVVIASGRPMHVAEKLRIILQVCSGLSYAHKRELVHRDIKPANIVILENGTAKLVDFGIARLGGNRLTRTGQVVGSLNYMSPEQLDANLEVDLQTDVYSTGVVLYQLLTGVLPFEGGSTAATLMKIVHEPSPPIGKYWRNCPAELEAIMQKALAKNRRDRYNSVDDFALDIGRLQQEFEKKLLAEYLEQAADLFQRKDFAAARQHVFQVLRAAPQNTEAGGLLRLIKKGEEQQQRELQAQQFQRDAQAAFGKNDLSGAQQLVEEGLRLDSTNPALLSLKEAITEARAKAARAQAALRRAELALKSDDLQAASQSIDEAMSILPGDPGCKTLALQIAARIEQRLREQEAARQQKLREEEAARQRKLREEEAARKQKQREEEAARKQREFALAVNAIEKVMADARMLLFLDRAQEALEVLEKIESGVSQLPPRWKEQFEALRKEAQAKLEQNVRTVPGGGSQASENRTAELPDASNATVLMQPGFAPGEDRSKNRVHESDFFRPYTSPSPPPVRHPPTDREQDAIAPELMEFLEPVQSGWSRPTVWGGIAVAILAVIVSLVIVWPRPRPRPERVSGEKPPVGVTNTANYTYAEINAEPWGTIKEIVPATGEAQSAIGSATPLRVTLPPGQYTVTLEGPNHETKQVNITVPAQGGASSLVLFRKPDIKKLLSQE